MKSSDVGRFSNAKRGMAASFFMVAMLILAATETALSPSAAHADDKVSMPQENMGWFVRVTPDDAAMEGYDAGFWFGLKGSGEKPTNRHSAPALAIAWEYGFQIGESDAKSGMKYNPGRAIGKPSDAINSNFEGRGQAINTDINTHDLNGGSNGTGLGSGAYGLGDDSMDGVVKGAIGRSGQTGGSNGTGLGSSGSYGINGDSMDGVVKGAIGGPSQAGGGLGSVPSLGKSGSDSQAGGKGPASGSAGGGHPVGTSGSGSSGGSSGGSNVGDNSSGGVRPSEVDARGREGEKGDGAKDNNPTGGSPHTSPTDGQERRKWKTDESYSIYHDGKGGTTEVTKTKIDGSNPSKGNDSPKPSEDKCKDCGNGKGGGNKVSGDDPDCMNCADAISNNKVSGDDLECINCGKDGIIGNKVSGDDPNCMNCGDSVSGNKVSGDDPDCMNCEGRSLTSIDNGAGVKVDQGSTALSKGFLNSGHHNSPT